MQKSRTQKKVLTTAAVIAVSGGIIWAGYHWIGKAMTFIVRMHGG